MKKYIKYLTFILFFGIINFVNCNLVKAAGFNEFMDVTNYFEYERIQYFITKLDFTGTTLNIEGYAFSHRNQNYHQGNHSYTLFLRGNKTGNIYSYPLTSTSKYSTFLKVGGVDHICGDTEAFYGYCNRNNTSIGFEGSLDLREMLNSFSGSSDEYYDVFLGIEEYLTGIKRKTQIKTFPGIIGGAQTSEYRNVVFDLNKNLYASTWENVTTGVKARKNSWGQTSWLQTDFGRYDRGEAVYICSNVYCGEGSQHFQFVGIGKDYQGLYALSGLGSFNGDIDYTYGGRGSYALRTGGGTQFWEPTSYTALDGNWIFFTKKRNDYADINYVDTYTAKVGDKARVVASFYNNKANSPVYYKLTVGDSVIDEGTTTSTGNIVLDKEINATSTNRKVTLYIKENYTNLPNDMSTTLYATENGTKEYSTETGSFTPGTPIAMHKTYSQEKAYHETITISNPQNYELSDGDYSGASINRETALSYTVTSGATNGNISRYLSSIKNSVSSPKSTSDATIITNNNGNISTKDTIYVPYTDLSTKTIKTTYSGVGINNYTVVLTSTYKFSNLSGVSEIDSYTTENVENSHITTTINNSVNRKIKWYIYNDSTLVKSGMEAWEGNKTFDLNDYIVSKNGNITVKIIEPNGVVTQLIGETYVAEEFNITLTEGEEYTPKTPVRVTTTPNKTTKYFETFSVNSINTALNIKSGEGFENKLKINYSNQSSDIKLNNDEITALTVFPEQDTDLDYTETEEGVFVPLDVTSDEENSKVFELPEVMVEKKDGILYRKNDSRSESLTLLEGGRRWYTRMNANEGTYDFYNNIKHVGVNAINIKFYNQYVIDGSLLGNIDSIFKVIRVQNPTNPNYTYHKTYTLSELLEKFNLQKEND